MEDKIVNSTSLAFNELIEDMRINSFPEDEREKAVSRLMEIVFKKIFVDIMEKIGEEGRREYKDFLQGKPGNDELLAFFSEKIKDFDKLIEKAIDEVRDDMANIA